MIAETRALLTRHGQSEWNALGRWQGQADPPLTDLGRRQAHEAARSLGAVDGIWASDLQSGGDGGHHRRRHGRGARGRGR